MKVPHHSLSDRRGPPALLHLRAGGQRGEHVDLTEAVDPQAEPGARLQGLQDQARGHRVDDHVGARKGVEHRPHHPGGVRLGDLSARRHVPLPVRAVATDVDPPHARVVVVAAAELVHQPFPTGEECLGVPVGDVRAGLQRHERGCGVVEPAAWAVRQDPEAEPASVLLRILETAVEPREVVAPGGRLDASPRDLVPVVHIADRPASGLCCTAEPGVLATQGVGHLRRRHRNGPRPERHQAATALLVRRARAGQIANRGGWRLDERCNGECQRERGDNGAEKHPARPSSVAGGQLGGPLRCVSDSRDARGSRGAIAANLGRSGQPGSASGSCLTSHKGPGGNSQSRPRPPQGSDRAEGRR